MAIYSGFVWICPLRIVIFHSYVSLPEGNQESWDITNIVLGYIYMLCNIIIYMITYIFFCHQENLREQVV